MSFFENFSQIYKLDMSQMPKFRCTKGEYIKTLKDKGRNPQKRGSKKMEFPCDYCDHVSANGQTFKNHHKKNHKELNMLGEKVDRKKHFCPECKPSNVFFTKSSLEIHLSTVHSITQVSNCTKIFPFYVNSSYAIFSFTRFFCSKKYSLYAICILESA